MLYGKGIAAVHRLVCFVFFFQAEDGIRDYKVTGVQTCALPISIGYMAPEQIAGVKAYAPSDVFAFGVLLYQMCTGARPFTGETMWAVMDATVHSEPRALTALRPDTPPALAKIVQRCLAKDPAERYQSGEDVRAALRDVQRVH